MDEHFNLYYLHWWTLARFLFLYEGGKYSAGFLELIEKGGAIEDFERLIGPVPKVEKEWYDYARAMKAGITEGTYPLLLKE